MQYLIYNKLTGSKKILSSTESRDIINISFYCEVVTEKEQRCESIFIELREREKGEERERESRG